jgi:hypothetical protein
MNQGKLALYINFFHKCRIDCESHEKNENFTNQLEEEYFAFLAGLLSTGKRMVMHAPSTFIAAFSP